MRTPATVLIEHFDLGVRGDRQLALFEPRYNIAPTQDVVVVRADTDTGLRTATMMRWGLIPSWSGRSSSGPKPGAGPPMINARSETLAEKPTFRTALRRRRCLIPADGFYEWQQSAAGSRAKKQPFYIHRPDGAPFAFAGLWETWTDPSRSAEIATSSTGLTIESCTIVTTEANAALKELHDRMPVVLSPNDYTTWLDSRIEDPPQLKYLLVPCNEDELIAEPVSTHVNRVANDDPRCTEVERTLF